MVDDTSDIKSPTDSGITSAGTVHNRHSQVGADMLISGADTAGTAAATGETADAGTSVPTVAEPTLPRADKHSTDLDFARDSMAAIERQIVELVTAELIWDALTFAIQQSPKLLAPASAAQDDENNDDVKELSSPLVYAPQKRGLANGRNVSSPSKSMSMDRPNGRWSAAGPFSLPVHAVQTLDSKPSTNNTPPVPISPTITKPRRMSDAVLSGSSRMEASYSEPSPSSLTVDGTSKLKKEFMSRKKRDDDKPVVGTKVAEGHANFVLMYDMLTGLRIAVSRCVAKPYRELLPEDFRDKHKLTFDIMGNELTPSSKYDFKFKDYAPWVFRYIREHFKIEAADYLVSLTGKYVLSELGSPGKSGSFFYFSQDYRFIIKTIHHTEHKFLQSILDRYYMYIKANPNTLISRYYGLHRVKLPHGRKIHFVVMGNVFPPNKDIHETYDLKGSLVGREVSQEEIKSKPRVVMKDMNWLNAHKILQLGPAKRKLIVEQLKSDVEFLMSLNIMDYSLLTGIHHLRRGNSENIRDKSLSVFEPSASTLSRQPISNTKQSMAVNLRKAIAEADPIQLGPSTNRLPDSTPAERRGCVFYQDDGGLLSTDDNDRPLMELYYVGIIDILTPWNLTKKAEHAWKSIQNDKNLISAVEPGTYGRRFLKFIMEKVIASLSGLHEGKETRSKSLSNASEKIELKTLEK